MYSVENVLVIEGDQLGKSHDLRVELAPGVHLPPSNIAHHVVDEFQSKRICATCGIPRFITGQENTVVCLPLHKNMDGVTIRFYAAEDHLAFPVFSGFGLKCADSTSRSGFLPALGGVIHPKCDSLDPVSMAIQVVIQWTICHNGGGEHQGDFVLAEHIAYTVGGASFEAAIGQRLKPPGVHVVVCALLGVSNDQFDVVGAEQGQEILSFRNRCFGLR